MRDAIKLLERFTRNQGLRPGDVMIGLKFKNEYMKNYFLAGLQRENYERYENRWPNSDKFNMLGFSFRLSVQHEDRLTATEAFDRARSGGWTKTVSYGESPVAGVTRELSDMYRGIAADIKEALNWTHSAADSVHFIMTNPKQKEDILKEASKTETTAKPESETIQGIRSRLKFAQENVASVVAAQKHHADLANVYARRAAASRKIVNELKVELKKLGAK